MAQSLYLAPGEVAGLPGSMQALWVSLADPTIRETQPPFPTQFSAEQLRHMNEACRQVDSICGQATTGGLLAQTARSYTCWPDRGMDTLALPNLPVTNIRSITVQPTQDDTHYIQQSYTLPVTMGTTVYLTGGNTLRYIPQNQYMSIYSRRWPPFQDGDIVTVVYDCGLTSVGLPDDIKAATRFILGVKIFSTVGNPMGADTMAEDGSHISFGSRSLLNPIMTQAEDLLLPWTIKVLTT